MSRYILVFLAAGVFCATSAHASSQTAYLIAGRKVSFTVVEARRLTISSNCMIQQKLGSCEAASALHHADIKRLKHDAFGRNPGAMICSKQVGGEVVWSHDPQGNERTFCAFKDGSYVGTGTLAYYARKSKN